MSDSRYREKLEELERNYESMCRRCGECCGVSCGDPCADLKNGPDGRYLCAVYGTRHGLRRTVSGRYFMCVNIRDVIKSGTVYRECPYCSAVS